MENMEVGVITLKKPYTICEKGIFYNGDENGIGLVIKGHGFPMTFAATITECLNTAYQLGFEDGSTEGAKMGIRMAKESK